MRDARRVSSEGAQDGYRIRAVVRAAEIMELLAAADGGATLNELAAGAKLPKASAFRMLRTLEEVGFAERVLNSERWRLGVRCLQLGQAYLEQVDLRREALPVMEQLRDELNETVHLAVLNDHLDVVYLEKLESTHAVGIMMSRVGRTAPAFCTGVGKALLAVHPGDPAGLLEARGVLKRYTPNTIHDTDALRAELALVRERGFALDFEEHEPGVRCVAAAFASPAGGPAAAISVSGPASRMPKAEVQGRLAQAVVASARDIGRRMGAREGAA
jgi:IclR family KDG regulon transcriptional repressor